MTLRTRLIVGGLLVLGVSIFIARSRTTAPTPVKSVFADVPAPMATTCPEKLGSQKRVGIQAGHWHVEEIPNELKGLQWDFGSAAGGVDEVDINLDVAQKTASILERAGITVDLLPTTIPADYCANAFIAIHADGNDDTSVNGYKIAGSEWDNDKKAQALSDTVGLAYANATGMRRNPTITDNMTEYYAFNYGKFVHSLNKNTPGALIELGFITNKNDRSILVNKAGTLAAGIAQGIQNYFAGNIAPHVESDQPVIKMP